MRLAGITACNDARGKAGIAPDVSQAARRSVVVTHEIQVRVVDTDDALRACAKTATIARDRSSEHPERGAVSGGHDDRVERLHRAIYETHALRCELLETSLQLDASALDAIRQVKSDEGHGRAWVITWRRQRRRAAKPLGNRTRHPHRATQYRRRQRVEYGTDVLNRETEQVPRHDARS